MYLRMPSYLPFPPPDPLRGRRLGVYLPLFLMERIMDLELGRPVRVPWLQATATHSGLVKS